MKGRKFINEKLLRKVLWCVGSNNRTVEVIWREYTKEFRTKSLLKYLHFPMTVDETRIALRLLYRVKLVDREITRFEQEVPIKVVEAYRLTEKGSEKLRLKKF